MSTALKCVKPFPQYTGQCGYQPRAEDCENGWFFDARSGYYNGLGFLDAPEHLPSGSVRALDIGSTRLMVTEVERDGIVRRAAS